MFPMFIEPLPIDLFLYLRIISNKAIILATINIYLIYPVFIYLEMRGEENLTCVVPFFVF